MGFFWRIALAGQILTSYDLLTYFYPQRDFAAAALRAGRLPLWNPDLFMGAPFLANIQTAVFYPLNWLTLGLSAPQAVNVSILIHVTLAATFMFALLRFGWKLPSPAAFAGGAVFAFSGFFGQQVGHINQLDAACWLPLICLLAQCSLDRKSLRWALGGAIAWAAMFMAGHTQEVYLSTAGLGLYVLFAATLKAVGARGVWRRAEMALRAAAVLAIVVGFGAALSAVQAVPTFELSGESIRAGGLSLRDARSFSLPPPDLFRALLPGYIDNPFTEFIGYVGWLGLALALLAVLTRARHPLTWFGIGLALLALLMATGGYDPWYERLYRHLPGLNLFRVPARWLFLYTFAVSILAGIGCTAFCGWPATSGRVSISIRRQTLRFRPLLGNLIAFALLLSAIGFVGTSTRNGLSPVRPDVANIWIWMGLASMCLMGLGITVHHFGAGSLARYPLASVVVGLVVLELWFAAQALEYNHAVPAGAYGVVRPAVSAILADGNSGRTLSIAASTFDPGDLGDTRQAFAGAVDNDRVTDYVVALKYAEVLAPNLPLRYGIATVDGYDGGVLPLRQYVSYKALLLESGGERHAGERGAVSNQADGVLREQLSGLPDLRFLDQMAVHYVVADRISDLWLDNTFYDLGSSRVLIPGVLGQWSGPADFAATGLGLITYLEGGSLVDGQTAATIEIEDSTGGVSFWSLRNGRETAESSAAASPGLHAAGSLRDNSSAHLFAARFDWPSARYIRAIRIRADASVARLIIQGITLIDGRTQAGWPILADNRLRPIQVGDLKVYSYEGVQPRAFLASGVRAIASGEATLSALRQISRDEVVLEQMPRLASGEPFEPASEGKVQFLVDLPERVELRVDCAQACLLVLKDTYFPGWSAIVDGRPAPILRANGMFRAVAIPPGTSQVAFEFAPDSLRLGATTSLLAALFLAATWIVLTRGARSSRRRQTT